MLLVDRSTKNINKAYCSGWWAAEAHVAAKIREWTNSLDGRPQLAARRFAEGIETLPLALVENAGMDPLDTQVQLRSRGAQGKASFGIDVMNTKVADLEKEGVYDPLAVKEQVINAATEAACMILRIDDVIAASKTSSAPSMPQEDLEWAECLEWTCNSFFLFYYVSFLN